MSKNETWKVRFMEWVLILVAAPIGWLDKHFPSESQKKDEKTCERLRRACKKENARIINEINIYIDHLPGHLQESYLRLNIEPLQLFLATQAIGNLIMRRAHRVKVLPERLAYISLSETGKIQLGVKKYDEAAFIQPVTTIVEIQMLAKISDEELIKKLLEWINHVAPFWKKIIPEFEAITMGEDSESLSFISLRPL